MFLVLFCVDTQVHTSLYPHLYTGTYDPGLALEEETFLQSLNLISGEGIPVGNNPLQFKLSLCGQYQ